MDDSAIERGRLRLAGAVIVVALGTFVSFVSVIYHDWTNWDDTELLLKDSRWHGFTCANLAWMWSANRLGHYQPLTWMSYALDYELWGVNTAGLYLTNIVLHSLTAALLAALLIHWLRRTGQLEVARVSLIDAGIIVVATLLWSVHPLRVEAVAWIPARRDLLSAAFSAWVMWLWLGRPGENHVSAARRFLATAAGAAAMLSKSQAMVLPALLLVALVAEHATAAAQSQSKRAWHRRVAATWPLWLLALPIAVVSARFAAASGATWSWDSHGFVARAIQSAWGVARHLRMTLWPTGLTPLVPLPRPWNPWSLEWLGPAALVGISGLTMPLWARRAPGLALALLWLVIAIAPVSGWWQSGPQLTADRYTYVATWPFSVLVAVVLFHGWRRCGRPQDRPFAIALGAVVVGILSVMMVACRNQLRVWREPVSLWSRAIEVHPNSAIAHANLAHALDDAGELWRALEHYRTAVRLDGMLLAPRAGYATLIARLGELASAREQFEAILALDPSHEAALIGLANLDLLTGATNMALQRYEAALAAHPDSADAAYNLATLRLRMGDVRTARNLLEALVVRQPHHALAWHNLGVARQHEGDRAGAVEAYDRALKLAPALGGLHAPAHERQ